MAEKGPLGAPGQQSYVENCDVWRASYTPVEKMAVTRYLNMQSGEPAILLVGDLRSEENCAELCSLESRVNFIWGTGSHKITMKMKSREAAIFLLGDWKSGENCAEV